MAADSAHKSSWQIAEVIFGVPFVAAIVLQFIIPLARPGGIFRLVFIISGAILFIVGVEFIVLARREFARRGQHTDPGHPTTSIVTSGVFSVSRNPLYFGAVCSLAGIGLAVNLPWVLILLLPGLIACHYVLIVPEEKYLSAKFGDEYFIYAASVHRWIGRKRIPHLR